MKAISIRQPWAWLIVAGHKDIENRTWRTPHRGPILIHAAKGMTKREYWDLWNCIELFSGGEHIDLPKPEELQRGGIVGIADLVDIVPPYRRSSPWHMEGQQGFKLKNARPLPFIECKGMLQVFNVPDEFLIAHTSIGIESRAA